MDLVLMRVDFRGDGIFSELRDPAGNMIAVTLERAYQDALGDWTPKLPDGQYICVRGTHHLDHVGTIETFEIENVPGHSGILFHIGNYNHDSDGCVLVGTNITETMQGQQVLTSSKLAFEKFMKLQNGVDKFALSVKSD